MAKNDLSILQSHSIDEAEARHERKRRAHQPNTYRILYVALNVSKFLRDLALSSLPYAFSASADHAAFNDGLVRSASSTSATASWEVSNKGVPAWVAWLKNWSIRLGRLAFGTAENPVDVVCGASEVTTSSNSRSEAAKCASRISNMARSVLRVCSILLRN
jgi:hypothetical protein